MRTINKNAEPPILTQHRCAAHADYDNFAGKDGLRQALAAEQRGLCCYCLSRIRPRSDGMKIAHWHSQARYPHEQLDYGNLLGACLGNPGQPIRNQHCDTRQADRDISRNPANPAHRVEDLIRYQTDGTVASTDPLFDRELNDVLNLNAAFLKNNRKAALDGLLHSFPRQGDWTRPMLERSLRHWNGDEHAGDLEPFCQVVIYWLRKRLARM